MLSNIRVAQLLVMLAVLTSLFFWRTVGTTTADEPEQSQKAVQIKEVCDLTLGCEITGLLGTFTLKVSNGPIKAEQWINLNLQGPKQPWQIVKSNLVGKTMFMGRIPISFKQIEETIFAGKTMVGACTTDKMLWQLQVEVTNGKITEQIDFDFEVLKH